MRSKIKLLILIFGSLMSKPNYAAIRCEDIFLDKTREKTANIAVTYRKPILDMLDQGFLTKANLQFTETAFAKSRDKKQQFPVLIVHNGNTYYYGLLGKESSDWSNFFGLRTGNYDLDNGLIIRVYNSADGRKIDVSSWEESHPDSLNFIEDNNLVTKHWGSLSYMMTWGILKKSQILNGRVVRAVNRRTLKGFDVLIAPSISGDQYFAFGEDLESTEPQSSSFLSKIMDKFATRPATPPPHSWVYFTNLERGAYDLSDGTVVEVRSRGDEDDYIYAYPRRENSAEVLENFIYTYGSSQVR